MFWRSERNKYGHVLSEKVQVYECTFSTTRTNPKDDKQYKGEVRVLVVCGTVEEAIAACRKQWPDDFVLHQIVKRNQRCDLIIADSVLGLSEEER
jgi:hypothetical protein